MAVVVAAAVTAALLGEGLATLAPRTCRAAQAVVAVAAALAPLRRPCAPRLGNGTRC